jgi:hypothetical protein
LIDRVIVRQRRLKAKFSLEKLNDVNATSGHFPEISIKAQHRRPGFIVSGLLCFWKGT